MTIEKLINSIHPLDEAAMKSVRARQDRLTKPQGSLGRLEDLSVQIAGITGLSAPHIQHKVITVMAGDHGVTAEGVSAFPREVTVQMVENFLNGGAAINVLARLSGARVVVVDMGVAVDIPAHVDLVVKKIGYGTGNIVREAAMSREQAIASVLAGADVVATEAKRGLDILVPGDMGIGNTTPSQPRSLLYFWAKPPGRSWVAVPAWTMPDGREKSKRSIRPFGFTIPTPPMGWMCSPNWADSKSAAWLAQCWRRPRAVCRCSWTVSSRQRRRCLRYNLPRKPVRT